MPLMFQKIPRGASVPEQSYNKAFLIVDNWDDYSYKTLFYLTVFDEAGVKYEIGNVKIGYVNQEVGRTEEQIPVEFSGLHENYFSLGQEAEYYQKMRYRDRNH